MRLSDHSLLRAPEVEQMDKLIEKQIDGRINGESDWVNQWIERTDRWTNEEMNG